VQWAKMKKKDKENKISAEKMKTNSMVSRFDIVATVAIIAWTPERKGFSETLLINITAIRVQVKSLQLLLERLESGMAAELVCNRLRSKLPYIIF
jgi:hypothetical protein